jgi:hypothetical protein
MASQYLENLCDYLYDDLRPRILHEPRITALCEVCTVLQALMVLDVSMIPDTPVTDELDELSIDLKVTKPKEGLDRLHISQLLQMVLQDAQTRLFFKAQSMIQSDIRLFNPKPEDLNYPEILRGTSHYFMLPCAQTVACDSRTATCNLNRSSGKRERQPNVPTSFYRQARYVVSDVTENGVDSISTS